MAGGASLLSVLLPEKPEAPSFRAEPFTDQYVTRQHIRAQTGAAGLIESRHMRSLRYLIAGGRVPDFPGQDSGPGQAPCSSLRSESLREGISRPVTGGQGAFAVAGPRAGGLKKKQPGRAFPPLARTARE